MEKISAPLVSKPSRLTQAAMVTALVLSTPKWPATWRESPLPSNASTSPRVGSVMTVASPFSVALLPPEGLLSVPAGISSKV